MFHKKMSDWEYREKLADYANSKKPFMKRAYDNFFEGYEEDYIYNGKRKKIVRCYKAEMYMAEGSDFERRKRKIFYFILYVIAAAGFLYTGTLFEDGRAPVFVSALQAVSVMLFILTLFALVRYSISGKWMTIYEFKSSSPKVKQYAKWTGIFILAKAGGEIIASFLFASASLSDMTRCLLMNIVSTMCVFTMYHMESNTVYIKIDSDDKLYPKGK